MDGQIDRVCSCSFSLYLSVAHNNQHQPGYHDNSNQIVEWEIFSPPVGPLSLSCVLFSLWRFFSPANSPSSVLQDWIWIWKLFCCLSERRQTHKQPNVHTHTHTQCRVDQPSQCCRNCEAYTTLAVRRRTNECRFKRVRLVTVCAEEHKFTALTIRRAEPR